MVCKTADGKVANETENNFKMKTTDGILLHDMHIGYKAKFLTNSDVCIFKCIDWKKYILVTNANFLLILT